MINEKNCTYLYVGNVTNGYADNADVDIDSMPAGSVVLVKIDQTTVKSEEGAISSSPTTLYQLINKLSNGTIVRSPQFNYANVVSKGKLAYTMPTEQVSFIGYDGSTINGLGTITLGESYIIGLWLNHTKGAYDHKGEVKHISAYATDTTQATVAKLLMESHLKNFSPLREQNPSILCDRIAKTTSIAALTAGNLFKVTKGSKIVEAYDAAVSNGAVAVTASTISDDMVAGTTILSMPSSNGRTFTFVADLLGTGQGDYHIWIGTTLYTIADAGTAQQNADAIVAALNAGNQVIASDAAGTSTTVTIKYKEGTIALPPVVIYTADDATEAYAAVSITEGDSVPVKYGVGVSFTSNSTATITLDEPWQGATGYILNNGTTEATRIGVATLNGDAWGLKFTGVKQPFNPQVDENVKIDFDVLTDSFGTYGTEYKAVKPTKGNGSYEEVAQLEAYTQGNETWYRNSDYPSTPYRREATAGTAYDILTVSFKNAVTFAASGVTVSSPWTAIIATKSGLSYDTLDTAFGA